MLNMCCELCINGDATRLIEGLDVGGTAYKGSDGAAPSYCCDKSIYSQMLLLDELNIKINATASGGLTERRDRQALLPAVHVLHCLSRGGGQWQEHALCQVGQA